MRGRQASVDEDCSSLTSISWWSQRPRTEAAGCWKMRRLDVPEDVEVRSPLDGRGSPFHPTRNSGPPHCQKTTEKPQLQHDSCSQDLPPITSTILIRSILSMAWTVSAAGADSFSLEELWDITNMSWQELENMRRSESGRCWGGKGRRFSEVVVDLRSSSHDLGFDLLVSLICCWPGFFDVWTW